MPSDPSSATGRGDPPFSPVPPSRTVIVAPIYNHAAAVVPVLQGLARYDMPVIVVNDGSTDETAVVLERWQAEWSGGAGESNPRLVQSHAVNQGKAAALRTGFAQAARLGFTHAATIDTDGQHDPADLQRLLDRADEHPEAIIIGARVREGSDAPPASRFGRTISNGLVWLESGVKTTDCQSGMRIYPLARMDALTGHAARYGFETEVIVRAGWHGVPVIETPIRCIYRVPGGRTTHVNIKRDTLAHVGMHAGLLARAHLPGPIRLPAECDTGSIPRRVGRWLSPWRLVRMARGDAQSRERFAASIGVGLLMATLPIYGAKTVVCLWLSGRFRLHPLAVVGTSSLSTPPLGFVFVSLSIYTGSLLLHGHTPDLTGITNEATRWSTLSTLVTEWLVGSVIAGTVLGLLGYAVTRALLLRSRPRPEPAVSGGASPRASTPPRP